MHKRIVSFITVMLLVLFMTGGTSATLYNDTSGHCAETAIDKWSGYGIVQGSDGEFRPDDYITRSEFAVIINRIMQYQSLSENTFIDVDNSWYTDSLLKANEAGVIQGCDGFLRPYDFITRQEAAVMLGRALGMTENADQAYLISDSGQIASWAAGYIGAMASAGYIDTSSDFRPNSNITRAETVSILDRVIITLIYNPGIYSTNASGNVLINCDGVTLSGCTITGNLIITGLATTVSLINVNIGGDIQNMCGAQVQRTSAPDSASDSNAASGNTVKVTIPDGYTIPRIFNLLEKNGVCSADDLFQAAENTDYSQYCPYLSESYNTEGRVFSLEGYLLPDTYEFYKNSTPDQVFSKILANTTSGLSQYSSYANSMGYSVDELLTIASIVQKESGGCTNENMSRVASVVYNRLNIGQKLQMNVTQNYVTYCLAKYTDYNDDYLSSLYDTYDVRGLPAGPICSPSLRAIAISALPADTNYLYFVSDSYGSLYFATNYESHLTNIKVASASTGYIKDTTGDGLKVSVSTGNSGGTSGYSSSDSLLDVPSSTSYSGYTVMLDPGHGGTDSGGTVGSLYEKDVDLAICMKLKSVLESQGVTVLLTRYSDETVNLDARSETANTNMPDIFVSIHCNTADQESANGIETHYYPGYEQGARLAQAIQDAAVSGTSADDLGCWQQELAVLHYNQMPSAQCEVGYLTNTEEQAKLTSDDYQSTLAYSIANGIFTFLLSM